MTNSVMHIKIGSSFDLNLNNQQLKYRITHLSDGGATATIGFAERITSGTEGPARVVIKRSHEPTELAEHDLLRDEAQFTRRLFHLRAKESRDVPIARVPQLYAADRMTLVMEYAPGLALPDFLARRGGKLDPRLALRIILPYLYLLELVHREHRCYLDSKLDHLFWDAEQQQLTVIDWNTSSFSAEGEAKELRLAGYFLYTLILGQAAPQTAYALHAQFEPPQALAMQGEAERAQDFRDLPFGCQLLLYRALDWHAQPRRLKSYTSVKELRVDVERLDRWLSDTKRFVEERPDPNDRSQPGLEASLIWQDLAIRSYHANLDLDHTALYHRFQQDWQMWERMVGLPSIEMARNELVFGNYDHAVSLLRTCLAEDPASWRLHVLSVYVAELAQRTTGQQPTSEETCQINRIFQLVRAEDLQPDAIRRVLPAGFDTLDRLLLLLTVTRDLRESVAAMMRAELEAATQPLCDVLHRVAAIIQELRRADEAYPPIEVELELLQQQATQLEQLKHDCQQVWADFKQATNEPLEKLPNTVNDLTVAVMQLDRRAAMQPIAIVGAETRRWIADIRAWVDMIQVLASPLLVDSPEQWLPINNSLNQWQASCVAVASGLWLIDGGALPDEVFGIARRAIQLWHIVPDTRRTHFLERLRTALRQIDDTQLPTLSDDIATLRQHAHRLQAREIVNALDEWNEQCQTLQIGSGWRENHAQLPEIVAALRRYADHHASSAEQNDLEYLLRRVRTLAVSGTSSGLGNLSQLPPAPFSVATSRTALSSKARQLFETLSKALEAPGTDRSEFALKLFQNLLGDLRASRAEAEALRRIADELAK